MDDRWVEEWSYVEDFRVPHWKENWVLVVDTEFKCSKCNAKFSTNSSFKFHQATSHTPTGQNYLVLVKDFFSIQNK